MTKKNLKKQIEEAKDVLEGMFRALSTSINDDRDQKKSLLE